jgi:hypothetical protein
MQGGVRGCFNTPWLCYVSKILRYRLAPFLRGGKILKVPLFKGDFGAYTSAGYHAKKFSNTLLEANMLSDIVEEQL